MRKSILTALIAAVVMMGLTGSALAKEGQDGNNLVCGGVPTKALLIKYAKGGADPCGHREIGAIWARYGITPQVASKMHSGTVCSNEGLISTGREHSPDKSEDKLIIVDGSRVFERPLSVWGETCYSAWVGFTESGQKVAVLKGCGNGEGHLVRKPRPLPCVHTPRKHRRLCAKPAPKPAAPVASSPSITIVNAPVFNQAQQQGQQQGQAQTTCIANGGIWIESTLKCESKVEQVQCNENQVLEGNRCRSKTCQEEGNCPKEKTCAEQGEVGKFPECRPHNCEELGNCPPPPHCENGEVGTFPTCHPPTCQELGTCKPPPTIVSVTTINDLRIGDESPNFCVTWEVPGSDTATLTMSPKYSNFGSRGGKITMSVTGSGSECALLDPPTEVPPGGLDKMTVTLRDNTTGLPATPEIQEFRIEPEPVNPG